MLLFLQLMAKFILCQHVTILGNIQFWFPYCFFNQVSFPFDKILITMSLLVMFDYCFNFVNFLFFQKFWWRSGIVFAMSFGFKVRFEQYHMENIVDFPVFWEFQLVCHWSYDFFNFKWSFSFQCHFLVIGCFQVLCVKPYFFTFLEGCKCVLLLVSYLSSG